MKKLIIFAIPLFIVFAYSQNCYARSSYKTYEVSQIRSDGIVVKDFQGIIYVIEKDPGDLKVGDIVRYDASRHRLRKSPWQKAKIINITDRTLTLEANSGEQLELNINKYRGKFNKGDQVLFKGSTGQIKKSGFQEVESE